MDDPLQIREKTRRGEILPPQRERFELYENLSRGSSAQAKFLKWDSQQTALVVQDDPIFTAYDSFSRFAGITTERGIVEYFPDSHRWEVVELYRYALWFEFVLASDLSSGSSTASITVTASHEGREVTGSFTIANTMGFKGSSTNPGTARRRDDGSYIIDQLKC